MRLKYIVQKKYCYPKTTAVNPKKRSAYDTHCLNYVHTYIHTVQAMNRIKAVFPYHKNVLFGFFSRLVSLRDYQECFFRMKGFLYCAVHTSTCLGVQKKLRAAASFFGGRE